MEWLQMMNGAVMNLELPNYHRVSIDAIAHSLSMQVRYHGHTRKRLSIAEHSVHVAEVLPPEIQYQGLMHDGHEAVFGDIPTPWKRVFPKEVRELEERHWQAFARAFGLPVELDPRVKEADTRMLITERNQIMGPPPMDWKIDAEPYEHVRIAGWPPSMAKRKFLNMYHQLRRTMPVGRMKG